MKKVAILAVAGMIASSASATLYTDSTGDILPTGAHIDIVSVEVNNDATDISFKITANGDISAAGWGNFMIGIDPFDSAIGDTASNGWSPRPISFPVNPIEYWIGTWGDGGGDDGQLWQYSGTWNQTGSTPAGLTVSTVGTMQTITVPLASLNLGVGDLFYFDVFSSGGGGTDGAIDSLQNPAQTISNWGDAYAANTVLSYTVVPEPASLSMLALGGLAVARLRRRRS